MTNRPYPKYASRDARRGPITTCSTCGLLWSQSSMSFQYNFRGGNTPINTQILRCPRCIDGIQWQAKLIVIPPDPPPFFNTRPESYVVDETNWLTTQDGDIIETQSDELFITSIPNPSNAGNTTVLFCSIAAPSGSVAVAYLDLFAGNPSAGGYSVLAAITGSATRTNIASQLTTTSGIATNTSPIVITSSSAHQTNISYAGLYNAASGGTLLMSGTVGASPTIALGNPVQFDALTLSINLN